MSITKNIYSAVLLATLILSVYYFIYAFKRRMIPGSKNFIVLLISILIYNGGYVLELNAKNISDALFWYNFEHIAIPIQPYLWLLISLDFIGCDRNSIKIKLIKIGGLIHPVVFYIVFFTNKFHYLYDIFYKFESNGYFPILVTQKGMFYNVTVITGTALTTLMCLIYLKSCFKNAKIFRYNYLIMILASLFPWASVYFYQSSWNTLNLDFFPIALIISEIIYLYGIYRFRMMSTIPIAHNIIFQQSKEGILLIDINDYIIDENSIFLILFPNYNAKSKINTLSKFLADYPDVKYSLDNSSNHFCLTMEGENRYYSAKKINIFVENNIVIGKMLVISDITLFIENQNRLEYTAKKAMEKAESSEIAFLQSQIKPHFLNNTLTLISSMITRDLQKAKEIIVDLSEYLMNCYQFDSNTPLISLKEELDFIDTYVAIEKARFMERLEVKINFDKIPNVKVPRLILQPLVENAIRHGVLKKAQGGIVEIVITHLENEVIIQVNDDGVGISPDRIPVLLEGVEKNQGVGIINIHKRLIKYFGIGLTIQSKINSGTSISFSIPYEISGEKVAENDKCNCS